MRLTPRQSQIANLIAQGNSNKEIAAKLGICEGWVKICLSQIYSDPESGVDSRLTLAIAILRGRYE